MIRRPPRSTLFPTRRSSDLLDVHADFRRRCRSGCLNPAGEMSSKARPQGMQGGQLQVQRTGHRLPPLPGSADPILTLLQIQLAQLPLFISGAHRTLQAQGLAPQGAADIPVRVQLQLSIVQATCTGDRPAQGAWQLADEQLRVQSVQVQVSLPGYRLFHSNSGCACEAAARGGQRQWIDIELARRTTQGKAQIRSLAAGPTEPGLQIG